MWFVYCVWAWFFVSTFATMFTRGVLAAANFALPSVVLAFVIHIAVWFFLKHKTTGSITSSPTQPTDQIYEQVADELARQYEHPGLMTRAIAEGDGDIDKTKYIYIKLRAMALMKEQEQNPEVSPEVV